MIINVWLRSLTLILFAFLGIYWGINEKKAAKVKQKTSNKSNILERMAIIFVDIFIILNLMGLVFFPFHNLIIQSFGFLLFLFGFSECIIARETITDNWTQSYEYQIKEKHELITKGIYRYVRHPIYGGMLLYTVGGLLLAGSYTFIIIFLLTLLSIENYAKREERLLSKHFGNKYQNYMKTTKKFIPFIY